MSPKRRRIFVLNDPHALRVSPELAVEIGFNESLVLLQLEFLISISDHVIDGRVWTYQAYQDLKDRYFPWWSIATISRTMKSLEEKGLIISGNFNRAGFDRTQWYTLNEDGLRQLESIRLEDERRERRGGKPILQIAKSISQGEQSILQDETSISQDEQPIPETTAETTTEKRNPRTIQELEEEDRRWKEHREHMAQMGSFRRR
ncbi:MAG: hypothetical protein M3Q71_02285 [Chloroflexota bacterium]|nr:hypothetical protein [Chloroflexota bacterium]